MIFGITGPAGSGKSLAAEYLAVNYGYTKAAFADPIKSMLKIGLRLSDDQVNGLLKSELDERYGVTPREMMQTLGTEWGRGICENIWVTVAEQHIRDNQAWQDVRFENEARMIRQSGGHIIHIFGRDRNRMDHSSEGGICYRVGDKKIINSSSKTNFYEQIDEIVRSTCASGKLL